MNFILRILLIAIVCIVPLDIDAYAINLDAMIVEERGEQPELTDELIEKLNAISSEEFISALDCVISFDLPKLIEKLVININSEISGTVDQEFLKNIANAIQYVKCNAESSKFKQSITSLQKFKNNVKCALNTPKEKTLFSTLWLDSIEKVSFSETKETLAAKLESLVIAYLESFTALCPTKRNTLQSLTLITRYGATSSNDNEQIRKAFNQIANNTIGKLLLYRILIEAKKKPFSLYITSAPAFFNVAWDQKNNVYGLGLSPKLAKQLNFPVFADTKADSTVMYRENEPDLDLAIFHELVHLFHKLTNGTRSNYYASGKDTGGNSDIRRHPLFLYYYGDHRSCDINNDHWKTSLFIWHALKQNGIGRVNFEEMLTICGLPQNSIGYSIGDELSENLYRASKNSPLRFGHKLLTFVESEAVKQKVIECIGYYYNTFKKLGKIIEPTSESRKTDDYDFHSSGMTRLDGIDGMYFYTIPNYISRHELGLFKNHIDEYYTRKDLSNAYYYLKECCCKTGISSLKLD